MPLETGTYISDLVATNPANTDVVEKADDHLRLIKSTLLASFPGITGALTATHTELNILDGATLSTAELNILDGVTASTAELNILDGALLDVNELNILNGATLSTAELNILDGVTATAAELNILDGALLDVTELNYVNGVTSAIQTQLDAKLVTADVVGQQTIWVPAGAMTARTTNGAASGSFETTTNDVMLKYFAFDAATKEGVQFGIQMPKSWDEGTIIAQFVWTHPSTTTNFGVSWELAAVAFANDDAADTAFGTLQEIDDTGGTTYDIYISDETPAITVAGTPAAEEFVMFQVTRDPADAGDTMAVDAWLLGVKIHYTTNAAKDD